MAKRFTTGN